MRPPAKLGFRITYDSSSNVTVEMENVRRDRRFDEAIRIPFQKAVGENKAAFDRMLDSVARRHTKAIEDAFRAGRAAAERRQKGGAQ
jgi:hypothetical protein